MRRKCNLKLVISQIDWPDTLILIYLNYYLLLITLLLKDFTQNICCFGITVEFVHTVTLHTLTTTILKAIFMVQKMLTNQEIILDALWHQHLCPCLLLSVNVRRQSLHLAVFCKPDCPSRCTVPLSARCNLKTCTGQQLASYPAPPAPVSARPSVLRVLRLFDSLTSDICESDQHMAVGYCDPEPSAGHGSERLQGGE